MIWYRVGGRDERVGFSGMSHFIEHMMFKGTERFGKGEIDYQTTVNGGYNNAFTGHDFTAYYFSFSSDRWVHSLEMEADRMVNTRFDRHEFELERQVILEESRMSLDNPWEAMQQLIDRVAFPDHPYGKPIIGLPHDISRFDRRSVRAYYRRFYVPGNATLVIVGDFERDAAVEAIRRCFGSVPGGRKPRHVRPKARRMAGPWRGTLQQPSGVTRIMMAFPAPALGSPDFVRLMVLDRILSQGKLSRLHQRLVEQEELVSFQSTELEETIDPYHFILRFELVDGVSPDRVIAAVQEVLGDLGSRLIDPDELVKARNQSLTSFLTDLESPFDQAFQLGLFAVLDRWENLNRLIERVEAVQPVEIRDCVRRYLSPDLGIVCVLPAEENHG
jgi:zinc protease